MSPSDVPFDSTRARFVCPSCSQSVWLYRGETLDTHCPHCGSSLGSGGSLIAQGTVDSEVIVAARRELIDQLAGARTADLSTVNPSEAVLQKVPGFIAGGMNVFPIECHEDRLTLAVPETVTIDTLMRLGFLLNSRLRLVVAPTDEIRATIDRVYRH